MEATNTVTLSLNDYNDLLKCKEAIEKSGYVVNYFGYDNSLVYMYYSKEEGLKHFTDMINSMQQEIYELKNPKIEIVEPTIKEIKAMSVWQFRKWKKG